MIVNGANEITCSTVSSDVIPCLSYVAGTAGQPSEGCCDGVRSLNAAAETTANRQTACGCIKSLAGFFRQFDWNKAAELSGICGVNLGFSINAAVNCSVID
ncbi:hypothetical protein SUGI_0999680 [Cryptomeria japonica]|nr:hypothetical protein SUGI_0999680 [Cryptomeria japonica]